MKKQDNIEDLLKGLQANPAPANLKKKIITEIRVEELLTTYHLKTEAPDFLKSSIMNKLSHSNKYKPIITSKAWFVMAMLSLGIFAFAWFNPFEIETQSSLLKAYNMNSIQEVKLLDINKESIQLIGLISVSILILLGIDQLVLKKRV